MFVAFVRKLMSFHSSSSFFDGFFSIPSRVLCVPSFTSNGVTHIFHNKKLDLPSNFFASNLVVMVVLLAIALIPIMDNLSSIKQQRNTKSKTRQRKRRRSSTSKQSLCNKGTQDLMWLGNVPTTTGRREIFIEENTRVIIRSLS